MIYSKTCEYAVRALSYLASKNKGKKLTMISEVSRETGVPGPYIAKVFQSLVRSGILYSQRGPAGGFSFKKDPKEISLQKVVNEIDDSSHLEECVMGLDQCDAKNACPLHEVWESARRAILETMDNCSLVELTQKIQNLKFRETKRKRLNTIATGSLAAG